MSYEQNENTSFRYKNSYISQLIEIQNDEWLRLFMHLVTTKDYQMEIRAFHEIYCHSYKREI